MHWHRHYIAAAAVIALFVIAILGAGCPLNKFNTAGAVRADLSNLKQPSPAAPPTKEPYIPPEASKIPRPY